MAAEASRSEAHREAVDAVPLMPLAGGPPLPGEGTWEVVAAMRERPAVEAEVAYLRPDVRNTSFITGVLRMDPALVRGQLRPGTRDPCVAGPTPPR